MYPKLFNIEQLDMYTILLIVGLFAAVLLFKFICGRFKVDDATYNFFAILAVISIALGILSAILFQSVYNFIEKGIFELAGMTFMGGLIGGTLTFVLGTVLFAKKKVKANFWQMANYAAPCVVTGHIFGRLGCFCAPCCYGKPTDSIFGVQFPGMKEKVFPTQLFEVFLLAILLAVMLVLLFKYKKSNFLLLLYGFTYSIGRFLIEFLRGDPRGKFLPFFSPSQWQCIFLLLITTAITILIYKFKITPFAKANNQPDPPKIDPPEIDTANPKQ